MSRTSLAAALLAAPTAGYAHAGERMVLQTLPTGPTIAAAGIVVALTAVVGTLYPSLPAPRPRILVARRRLLPTDVPSWLGCATLLALVATGFLGSRDRLANPLTLAIWTALLVGLSFACLAFGNLFRAIDPWTGPARFLRRRLGRTGTIGLARLGAWPACAGYLALAWFEIVSLAPTDPAVLARAVLAYWLVILSLAVLEGEAWLAKGEALSVYFALVGRIAPVWTEACPVRVRHFAGLPGTQILGLPPLAPSEVAFVALVLASVSFDGLSETFRWLAFLGVNPLEFPGRSAVAVQNTLGLLIAWPMTLGLVLGAIALGRRLGQRHVAHPSTFEADAGRWTLSFLPIAAGYHAAHYLVALLTDGQYAIAALDDPFGRGWSLLGLPDHWVSFGFLSDRTGVLAVWTAQVTLVLGSHVLAVLLGFRLAGGGTRAHLPTTALMVLYTVFGLWLLSTPTGA